MRPVLAGRARPQLAGAVVAAAAAAAGHALARRAVPRRAPWWRSNFAGEPVDVLAGPASVVGVVAGSLAAGQPAPAVAAAVSGAVGLYDDVAGSADRRGLRGHLSALRAGEVTTGSVKMAGLGVGALLAGLLAHRRRPALLDLGLDAALIAGAANLINLLDLRPGRAAKALAALGLPLAAATGGAGLPVLGGVAGVAGPDLRGRSMLGDCGANAAGAALATAFVQSAPRPARLAAVAAVTALTLASERVSFTAVIDRTAWLRAVDRLGRRDPAPGDPAPGGPAPGAPATADRPTGDDRPPRAGPGPSTAS